MIDIAALAKSGATVTVAVSAQDLEAFGMNLYLRGREDAVKLLNEDKPYTREQVASLLNVSVRTVDNWRKNGVFGQQAKEGLDKVGSRVAIPRDIVHNMLKR